MKYHETSRNIKKYHDFNYYSTLMAWIFNLQDYTYYVIKCIYKRKIFWSNGGMQAQIFKASLDGSLVKPIYSAGNDKNFLLPTGLAVDAAG